MTKTSIIEEARVFSTCTDGLDRFTGRFFLPESRMDEIAQKAGIANENGEYAPDTFARHFGIRLNTQPENPNAACGEVELFLYRQEVYDLLQILKDGIDIVYTPERNQARLRGYDDLLKKEIYSSKEYHDSFFEALWSDTGLAWLDEEEYDKDSFSDDEIEFINEAADFYAVQNAPEIPAERD